MSKSLCGSLLLLLVLPGAVQADSCAVNLNNQNLQHIAGGIGLTVLNYGGATTFDLGYEEFTSEYRVLLHFDQLSDSMSGTPTAGGVRWYCSSAASEAIKVYVYRTVDNKYIREGVGNGTTTDCSSNWTRYEEGSGGEALCTDRAWTAGGGDFGATKLDSFNLPTSTGWFTWTFSDSLIAWFDKIIDETVVVDSTWGSQKLADQVLLLKWTGSGTQTFAVFASDNATSNQAEAWFVGASLVDLNPPVTQWQAAHRKGWSTIVHQDGGIREIAHKKDLK